MKRLIHAELVRLKGNWIYWAMVLGVAIFAIAAFSRTDFSAMPEFIYSGNTAVTSATYLFQGLSSSPVMSMWFAAILPVLLIAKEFDSREIGLLLMSGHTRRQAFLVKGGEFVILSVFLCLLFPTVVLLGLCFTRPQELTEGAWYYLRSMGLRALLDLAMVSIGLALVFYFKDLMRSVLACLTYAVFFQITFGYYLEIDPRSLFYKVISLHPMFHYQEAMYVEFPADRLEYLLISPLVIIVVSWVFSYRQFRRTELR